MKKQITLFMILYCTLCVAQPPEFPLYNRSIDVPGAYYKDLQDDFQRFIGEWKYEQGNNLLIVKIQKKEMQFIDYGHISVYADFLVAEYRYVENGVEKINTLPNLLINYPDPYSYNITANIIIKPVANNPNVCPNCGPNDLMVQGSFSDPERDILGQFPICVLRHKIENGVEKVFFTLQIEGSILPDDDGNYGPYSTYNIPQGFYELIKQP